MRIEFEWKLHYIKLHSGIHLPTTTIILPLNGVNSNLLNSSSQAFTRKFYCFIPNVKLLLVLVLNDSIKVPTEWGPDLDTLIYHHLNEANKKLTFRMEQYNFQVNAWELPFNKFELPHLEEDNCCSWKVHSLPNHDFLAESNCW